MCDSEALFFVDYQQAEVREVHVFGENAVSTDDDVDFARFERAQCLDLLGSRHETRQHLHLQGIAVQARREGSVMLLGEHGRGAEHRDLASAHRDAKRRPQGDLRLAEADVSADQPVHWLPFVEVGHHVVDGLFLVSCLLEGECGLELGVGAACRLDRIALRCGAFRIELQELLRHLLDRLLHTSLLRGERRPAESVELRLMTLAALELLDHPETAHGHEEFVSTRILDDHHLDGLRRPALDPVHRRQAQRFVLQAEILADSMVDVDDEVADGELP